ncbi:hypothetical protein AVEN_266820-1 [Araneus ventricosus]|uniref:Uncharacterized protein n=1 Tax=Araneus ventricosus TaxID=182803 RepID=A0A4Y2T6E3_ARAVE|nr:hypothetical protein AVEN_266820-1 [Araneus ventricosus]
MGAIMQEPQCLTIYCSGRSFSCLPGCIFTNPTLIELRQEIGHYDWLASPRADDVVLCSRMEIITKQAIECGLGISLGFCCLDYNLKNNPLA